MSFRVMMTADTVGGVWVYAMELARGLAKKNVEVCLALMGGNMSPSQKEEAVGIHGLKVFESDFKLEWMEDPWQDVKKAGQWLLELEAWLSPDVIHLNGYAHGNLPWRAPVLMAGHSCVLSWWDAVKKTPVPAHWDTYKQKIKNGIMAAGMVAAPSRTMLDSLHRHYGPLPEGRVVLNGRDPAAFSPGAKEPFIVTAGRLWDEAKNISVLAKAAHKIEWPVCVAGETRHPDMGVSSSVNKSGHPVCDFTSLHQIGYVSQGLMAKWLAKASIYVSPALYEPFGLTILEAALSGCALVLADIPSLRELWRDTALFANPSDPDDIAAATNRLSGDTQYRQKMAAFARKRALEVFTPDRMVNEYISCYQELSAQAGCKSAALPEAALKTGAAPA